MVIFHSYVSLPKGMFPLHPIAPYCNPDFSARNRASLRARSSSPFCSAHPSMFLRGSRALWELKPCSPWVSFYAPPTNISSYYSKIVYIPRPMCGLKSSIEPDIFPYSTTKAHSESQSVFVGQISFFAVVFP